MADTSIYDKRYAEKGYREQLAGYEVARWKSLDHFISKVARLGQARAVLDYGSGSGLFAGLWEKVFPSAELSFCDVSSVALKKLGEKYPQHAERCALIQDDSVSFDDSSFDVVVSIEVMEHVEDLAAYVGEIHRVLKPWGAFIWTTPCANRLSIEHLYGSLTGKIDPTPEGLRRWRWEEPTHLRRLKTSEISAHLLENGFSDVAFRFRAHLFSFLCTHTPPVNLGKSLRDRLMRLDYALFRRLPNGASMIGCATKER